MSNLLNEAYEGITSNYLATKIYDGYLEVEEITSSVTESINSAIVESITSNTITTCFPTVISSGAGLIGHTTAVFTRGYVQLNTLVSQPIRNQFRRLGIKVAAVNDKIATLILKISGINQELASGLIAAPIVEELVFRLPLLMVSGEDDVSVGVTDSTETQITKIALSVFSSIAFTYAHNANPDPGRAAGLFAGSMTMCYQALSHQSKFGGLINSVLTHMIHNSTLELLGIKSGKGISSHQPSEKEQKETKCN